MPTRVRIESWMREEIHITGVGLGREVSYVNQTHGRQKGCSDKTEEAKSLGRVKRLTEVEKGQSEIVDRFHGKSVSGFESV